MLQSMESKRVGHDLAMEQQQKGESRKEEQRSEPWGHLRNRRKREQKEMEEGWATEQ